MKKTKMKSLQTKKKVGLLIIITGDGKGKTTSALGITLRAVGHKKKVCFIEFMKGGIYSGEIDGLKYLSPYVELHIMGKGFYKIKGDPYTHEEHKKKAQEALKLAEEKILSGNFDIIILDEINVALKLKLVNLYQVLNLIKKKPPLMHLVMTGRDAPRKIIEKADIVTEMKEIKHPFKKGIEPQKGIDY